MELQLATRQKAKIRLGLSAVSGAGKTYSALKIANGIAGAWEKVSIIDTENNSAHVYSHLGPFNVLTLTPPFTPERYIQAIKICEDSQMEVIIIDSITHEWEGKGGILEMADALGGQYQSAWKTLTPRHEAFKQAIIQSSCHVITTVRRKQDYVLQTKLNKAGNMVQAPVKAGFKEVTREGWEYELTVNLELELNHHATASKDRTNLFMGKPSFIPTEETGNMIREWCEQGSDLSNPVIHPSITDFVTDDGSILQRINSCMTVGDLLNLFRANPDESNRYRLEFNRRKKELLNGHNNQ